MGLVTPESKILSACKNRLDWWERLGVVAYWDRLPAGTININGRWIKMGRAGVSDLMALVKWKHTYILFLECKTDKSKLSEAQIIFQNRVSELPNVIYRIIRSPKELDGIIEELTNYSNNKLNSIKEPG